VRDATADRPRRSANGYRQYHAESVRRVLWIRRALAAGFTVKELALILAERDRGGVPCPQVRALGAEKLAMLEQRLRELRRQRRDLRALLADWDRRLAAAGPRRRAGLLDALAEASPESPSRARRPPRTRKENVR
jgi:DNA-binding transcriptional MerR regulator